MTTNALRAQELKHQRENDAKRNELEKRKQDLSEIQSKRSDATTKRGQNLRAASDAANIIGGALASRRQARANNARTAASLIPTLVSLNDWEWYARDDQTAKDIASLPWGQRTGLPLNGAAFQESVVPGVLTINTIPGIGVTKSGVSGVNVAARQIYSWVRHANSGSANYEAVDLMQYLISLGSLYAAWGHASRMLGLVQSAVATNAYYPKAVMFALGADFNSYVSDLANFRARLNNISLRITRMFAAPKDMAYYKRCLMVYSHLYTDGDGEQDQLYAYKPAGFYKYNEIGGGCLFSPMPTASTPDALLGYIEELLRVLTTSESANIMSGDIRKAYGESNLWELPSFDEMYTIEAHYDPLVLDQMRNATIGIGTPYDLDIKQDSNGALIYEPKLKMSSYPSGTSREAANSIMEAIAGTRYLTTSVESPDEKVTLDITRCMYTVQHGSDLGDEEYWEITSSGLEIPIGMEITRLNSNTGEPLTQTVTPWFATLINNGVVNDDGIKMPTLLANFDYHPLLYVNGIVNIDGTKYRKFNEARVLGDIDRWTPMTPTTLYNMNDSVHLNTFYVPNRQ